MEASAHITQAARQERRRRRSRWRKWVFLGLMLLALRFVLPRAAAAPVASRLTHALGTQIEIGELTFQPLDAVFTLHGVTVHAPATSPASPPPIVADRVRIDVQWLPLLHRMLQVRELAFESARIDLDRFPDGRFGLANLERANPVGELPEGWSFALDRIAFRNSQLRVRDRGGDDATLLEATLRDATVSAMRRRTSAFGKATNLRVDALVGGGQLRVQGHYELRDDGLALDADVRVKDVPLAQAKAYLGDVGWSDLSGRVSGQLRWQREPRRRDQLSGRVILRRGSVRVARVAEPALAVRRVVADVAAIDLLKRRIAIRSVTFDGATLALRPDASQPIPLLPTPLPHRPPHGKRDGPRPSRPPPPSQWSWLVERFDTTGSRVRVLTPYGQFDLGARAFGENLGTGTYWTPLRAVVAGDEVVAAFDGTIRLTPGLTIEGHLTAGGIDFLDAARAAGLPWAEFVQSGRATVDLTVGFDPAVENAPPLYARGLIELTDVSVAGPDSSAFAVGAAGIDLALEGFSLSEAGSVADRGGLLTRVRFSAANINQPFVLLTRTSAGWILPPFQFALETATDTASPPLVPEPETPEISLGDVRCADGSLMVIDLVPMPAITWDVRRIGGSAHSVSLPALTYDRLQLRGSDRRFGTLGLAGSRRANTTNFEVSGQGVPLAATSPYLRLAGLPYAFAAGRGSFKAQGSIAAERWSADAALTLQGPVLSGSETSLEQAIGMAVPAALDALRDQGGDVTVQLALTSSRSDGGDTYADRVATGVRNALYRVAEEARAAAAASSAPVQVDFRPGQVELTPLGVETLAQIAALLGSHPDLVVELDAETSHQDRRWLAEQQLSGSLEESGGFRNVLRALGMRDARDRIRTALAARARGEAGSLERSDEALLTRLIAEAPPIDDARLAALGETRLTRVANHLADHYGVSGARVVAHGVAPERSTQAVVRARVARAPGATTSVAGSPTAESIGPPLAPGSLE